MGSIHEARCECGFQRQVTVGGGRHSFREKSMFPFYCAHCGMVDVNVAQVPDSKTKTLCPTCGAADTIQYGVPPVSLHALRPNLKKFWQKQSSSKEQAALQWGSREASESGHICPACHNMTLTFSMMPSILFD